MLTAPNSRICLCGTDVDALSMSQVIGQIKNAVDSRSRLAISMVNVAKVVSMRRDSLLRDSVRAGDLVLADGMPLVWLSRLSGRSLPGRIAGIDLMHELLSLADQGALRVYLLGTNPDVLQQTVRIARRRYPRIVVAGYRDGYFQEERQAEVAQAVRQAHADILLVAISSPRKEVFMRRWGDFMNVPVTHGVGGSFEVMAGRVRRAPKWMQRGGLEWLYRLLQEPRRMWKRYLVSNAIFAACAPLCILCRQRRNDRQGCFWINDRDPC